MLRTRSLEQSYHDSRLLPVLLGVFLCLLTGIFAWGLYEHDSSGQKNMIEGDARKLATYLDTDIHARITTLQRLANRWEAGKDISQREFERDVLAYIKDAPGFQAIEWVDPGFHVRWVVPLAGNEKARGLYLGFEAKRKAALELAKSRRTPTMTSPVNLVQGGKGVLIYFPVYVRDRFKGFVLAVFRTETWLQYVLGKQENSEMREGVRVAISIDDSVVYQQPGWDELRQNPLETSASLKVLDRPIVVRCRPVPEFVERSRSRLPLLVLLFGLQLSLLIALLVRSSQRAALKALEAISARAALEEEVRQHKKTEEALIMSRERFELAVDGANEGIWDWDLRTDVVFFSARWKEQLGYREDELSNHFETFSTSLHPDDQGRVLKAVESYLGGSSDSYEIEFRMRHKNGSWRWILARGVAVNGDEGKPVRMAGSHSDITLRKEMELALDAERSRLRLILDSAAEGIYGLDMDGLCTFCNRACVELLGYDHQDELIGKNMHDLIHHTRPDGSPFPVHTCKIFLAFEEGAGTHVSDELFWRRDGTPFQAEYWSYPQKREGRVEGAVVTFLDISERKHAEQELIDSKNAAETASRAKSEFLANMSHEIRTPLNGILGTAQLLNEAGLTEVQKTYLDILKMSSDGLLSLINDILDLSKIEAGRVELLLKEFRLADSIRQVVQGQSSVIRKKSLEVTFEVSPAVPEMLVGDQRRLKQVLLNLVGNAIKFTTEGSIHVRAELAERDENSILLEISVSDTGIGIRTSDQRRIFDPFTQADGSNTRRYGGTGLGLSISDRLAKLMGGWISLESSEGVGSTFTLHVPFAVGSGAYRSCEEEPSAGVWNGPLLRLLVVDDNETNLFTASEMLKRMGHTVVEARDGCEAVQKWHLDRRFDAILMDIQMSGMSGIEATRIIRNQEDPAAKTVIIALTARVMEEERSQILAEGFDGFVPKPVDVAALVCALSQCCPGTGTASGSG